MTALAGELGATGGAAAPRSRGQYGLFWSRLRRKRLAMISLAAILVFYGVAVLAPVVAPYSYTEQNLDRGLEGPSADHWLGTDRLGRDLLSRAMYSARTTLIVTVAVLVSGGLVIGNTLGLVAGYRGGWVDSAIMRAGEVFSSLPGLPMLILINAAFAPRVREFTQWVDDQTFLSGLTTSGFASYLTVFGALSLFFWVGTARLIRAQVLQLREREFVMAAQALGGGTAHIIRRHLLPNVAFLIILQLSGTLGAVAGSEIALTWFGVGIQPPTPSFGGMLFEGSGARTFASHPHLLLVPGLITSGLLFAFALLGDAVNDVIRGR